MILDQVTLRNFGLYAGSQTVTLTPPSQDKPIILIGGLNGGGKTTFLDALQLCRQAGNSFGLDGIYDLYLARIRAFQDKAPPEDWDGVYAFETK